MKTTVVLCTHNRCERLAKTLDSLAKSVLPDSTHWEVLVVDNNSSDCTRYVVDDFCSRFPGRFRYSFESIPGKSNALNRGIREASGEVLAFTDDDVTVAPTWLQNLTGVLEKSEWAGSSGRTFPETGFSAPSWLVIEERNSALLGLFDRGPDAFDLREPPLGNNMAFRRQVFEKHGYFRTDLGPRPGSEIRGEDSEFGIRILASGEKIRYVPSAVVYHAVPGSRIRKNYFLSWWFDKGRTDVRTSGCEPQFERFLFGVPVIFIRRLIKWSLLWMLSLRDSVRFSNKMGVWFLAGQIWECLRESHPSRSIGKHLHAGDATNSRPNGSDMARE